MVTTVQMKGVPELMARLESLSYDVRYKGGRFALRKAAQVVRDAAKENAQTIDDPRSREDIAKNIVERWSSKLFKQTGNLGFRVGVQGGAGGNLSKKDQGQGLPGGDTRHWRLVHFGSEHNAANPFLLRALEQNLQTATDRFILEYNKSIDRALKKASKAGG